MNRKWIWAVALLLLVVLAFALLEFHAAVSTTQANSQMSTVRSGQPQAGLLPPHTVGIYVDGTGRLASALRDDLAQRIKKYPNVVDVRILNALPERADSAVLVVEVGDRGGFWTPVYARSTTQVKVTYASDGVVSWGDQKPVVLSMTGVPTIHSNGDIQVVESTTGITTYPAYQRLLGEHIAEKVSAGLESQVYNPKP